jgi:hypothetical protein
VEADTVIRELPKKDQGYMRQLVANNIGKLIKKQTRNNESRKRKSKLTERETYTTHTGIKNAGSCTSTIPYIFMVVCLFKHKDNLAFKRRK